MRRRLWVFAVLTFAWTIGFGWWLGANHPELFGEKSVQTESHGETLPPCESEDSEDCYWDAEVAGNGEGTSFIEFHGHIYYRDYSDEVDG